MTENDIKILQVLNDKINAISKGIVVDFEELNIEASNPELQKLYNSIHNLNSVLLASKEYVFAISDGNLNVELPRKNLLLSPFKNLQSNLKHLVWQVEQIAKGDYSQNVTFLGDFSKSFNNLIEQLRERVKLQSELNESEEVFRLLFERSEDGILMLKNNSFIDCNSKAVEQLGYDSKDEIVGKSPLDFSPDLQPNGERSFDLSLQIQEMAYQNGYNLFEWVHLKKDGTPVYFEIMLTLIPHQGEKFLYTSWRDITIRKKAELALIESEQKLRQSDAAKDKFFSIIAHDLKNPFNIILNFANQLSSEFDFLSDDEKKALIHDLKKSSTATFNLLENLLEWSRSQRNKINFKPEEIDLYEMAFNSLYLFGNNAKNKNINLINLIEPDTIVFADRNMLNTIFRNLVSNAIKFTPEWGNITIDAVEDNESFRISVADSGIGISPLDIDKLFRIDVSHTTIGTNNEKGTGLGLILCKEFVEKHKNINPKSSAGKIWVESKLGNGTIFNFTLPSFKALNINSGEFNYDNLH